MLTFVGATEKKLLFGGVGGGFGEIQNSEDEDDRSRHCRKGQFLMRKISDWYSMSISAKLEKKHNPT